MASENRSISVDIPQNLLKKLKDYQQKQSVTSLADAVIAALQALFAIEGNEGNVEAYAPLDRLVELEEQVDRLTRQIADLQVFVMQPPVPEMTARLEHDRTETTAPAAIAPTQGDYCYEDFEDEPDEILYGFLEPEDSP